MIFSNNIAENQTNNAIIQIETSTKMYTPLLIGFLNIFYWHDLIFTRWPLEYIHETFIWEYVNSFYKIYN